MERNNRKSKIIRLGIVICLIVVVTSLSVPALIRRADLEYLEMSYTGGWIGVYSEDIKTTEALSGAVNTIGWFENFGESSDDKIKLCLDEGKYNAVITLQPKYKNKELTCEEVLSGDYDKMLINYLKTLSKGHRVKREVLVRFAHEMEEREEYESWYAWQQGDADLYIKMWRHVVDLGHKYAPNVKWVWAPTNF